MLDRRAGSSGPPACSAMAIATMAARDVHLQDAPAQHTHHHLLPGTCKGYKGGRCHLPSEGSMVALPSPAPLTASHLALQCRAFLSATAARGGGGGSVRD
jgi:hypothetical protein